MECRFCGAELVHVCVDLISAPLSNALLTGAQLDCSEPYYPLRVYVCDSCYLVQVGKHLKAEEIFTEDYSYFSSYSDSWLAHCRDYVVMISARLGLGRSSKVMEIASNDGYLLQFFHELGIPCFGVEPTAMTAAAARSRGIDTVVDFFSTKLARQLVLERGTQDLIVGNNVLAHVPDLNDFVEAVRVTLGHAGTATFEFPHLARLLGGLQFDTIYHEHFSYFSLRTVEKVFAVHQLSIYDVDELTLHGGSLRIYVKHSGGSEPSIRPAVSDLRRRETEQGIFELESYSNFQKKINKVKNDFLAFLVRERTAGHRIAGYGAAAKGNTLLNYAGIRGTDLVEFVVDRSPYKQGKFLPGSHIPIVHEHRLLETKPAYLIIFPWNLSQEIEAQLYYVRDWGCRFVVAVPELEVW